MKYIKFIIFFLTTFLLLSHLLPSFVNANDEEIHTIRLESIIFGVNYQEVKNTFNPNLVHIIYSGERFSVLTNRSEVNSVLEDIGIVVDNSKKIISTTPIVANNMMIRVIVTGTVVESIQEEIPFTKETVESKDIEFGEKKVVQEGVLGVRDIEIKRTYEDGILVSEEQVLNKITQNPIKEIVAIGVLKHSPNDVPQRGYNCDFWYSVVDQSNFTSQEKQWLKFVMYCESGCNAENDKHSVYKGLFQWNPRYWYREFPNKNIYDGFAQINNAVYKIRAGVNMGAYWPACHRRYVSKYGEFVR